MAGPDKSKSDREKDNKKSDKNDTKSGGSEHSKRDRKPNKK